MTGVVGTGLVLQNNGGGDIPVTSDGPFTFTAEQTDGTPFVVTASSQPTNPSQNCVITGGSGNVAGGNVTSVNVNCTTNTYAISGTVTGLEGTGLVLQNNGADDLPVNVNDGTFAFTTLVKDLASYEVTVKDQPHDKWQTCTVTNGKGNVAAQAVTDVAIACTTNSYKVKVTVTGLDGSGLALQNNSTDDLPIVKDGSYEFATLVESGAGYLVSVLSNPVNKSQTCLVTNGTATMAGADAEVSVACTTNKYSVGGTVTGLAAGNSVVLQNNSLDPTTVNGDGPFAMNTFIESGTSFDITVLTDPTTPNQTCVVSGGGGTVTAGNIETVQINCSTNTYTAGGVVKGLDGKGLILRNNNGPDLPVNLNGDFAFPPQDDGTGYDVTVFSNPTAKSQTCTVTNGTNTIAGANVQSIQIDCVTNTYSLGGTVYGVTGKSVSLKNNGETLTRNVDGAFSFPTKIEDGAAYNVTVSTPPAGLTCDIANASGTILASDVSNVNVECGAVSTVDSSGVTATVYPSCSRSPAEFMFGDSGGCGATNASLAFTDTVGVVPSKIKFQVGLGWSCGNAGDHNVFLNGVLVGTIASSSTGCDCGYGSLTRTIEFTNTASFIKNGTNTFRIDSVPNSGCYTVAPSADIGGAFSRVMLMY